MTRFVLAIDIGGSKVSCGVVDNNGAILRSHTEPRAKDDGVAGMMSTIRFCASCVLGVEPVEAVGATIPALADAQRGLWLYAPFSGMSDIPIADLLRDEFKLPAAIDNDVNACAIAEHRFGRCREIRDFVWMTVSTGVGGAIFADGKLLRGATNTAGETGHLCVEDDPAKALRCCCGRMGCLEAMASGTGLERRYGEAGVSAKIIGERARDGEMKAIDAFRQTGVYLGRAAAMCVTLLNPSAVIFGGGVSMNFDLFADTLHQTCAERVFAEANKNYILAPTALGYEAALLGAACLVLS
ncbi:MAG: ROK family protein [Kiritimatiellaeota bacterium]|nr:ROK family protein [Kiritimatiellota bacterium]